MNDVAGLFVLVGNYELTDVVETDTEITVTTGAVIGPTEAVKLKELGWELLDPNKVFYDKVRDTVVDETPSPLAEEFEAAEPTDPEEDEQW